MKKIVLSLLCLALALSLAACGNSSTPATTSATQTPEDTIAPANTPETKAPDDGADEIEAIGDVEVDRGLFDVTITIPADFIGEVTQEQLDKNVAERGYKSATLNDDGSVIYVMTKAQHEEMMDGIKQTIDDALAEMAPSDDYPSFVSIEANNNYTNFKVITTSEELGLVESFSVMSFYMYGGMYNHFNGTPVDNIHVDFINQNSGGIIQEANSKDMG